MVIAHDYYFNYIYKRYTSILTFETQIIVFCCCLFFIEVQTDLISAVK